MFRTLPREREAVYESRPKAPAWFERHYRSNATSAKFPAGSPLVHRKSPRRRAGTTGLNGVSCVVLSA